MVRFHSFIRVLLFIVFALAMSSGMVRAQYWISANAGLTGIVGSLAIDTSGNMFAGALLRAAGGGYSEDGVYRSTDGGGTWTQTPKPSTSEFPLGPVFGINPKFFKDGAIFCGGSYEYRSTDLGNSWQKIREEPDNPNDYGVLAFASTTPGDSGVLFIATGSTGFLSSVDDGNTWQEVGDLYGDGSYNGGHPTFIAATPSGAIILGNGTELDSSHALDGSSYGPVNGAPPLGNGIGFASNKTGLRVVGGTGGLYFTTKYVQNLAPIYPFGVIAGQSAYSFIVGAFTNGNGLAVGANGDIFAALTTGGVSLSTDTGRTWTDISSGADTINAFAFNPKNGELFAATNNGVFRFNPSGSGVKEGNPSPSLTLEQNTPNPVSSNTSIGFTVPESGLVSIRVFDATGREVATVANGFYATGSYGVTYDASRLPVGAYYYRLEADGQIASRMFVVEH